MVPEISIHELKALIEEQADFLLLDVREAFEYEEYNIKGYHIPLAELPIRMIEIKPYAEKTVIVHCAHGVRSLHAAHYLMHSGFQSVYSLQGGIAAWIEGLA
jgi:rhodanese-related sulfurtransferase